MRRIKVCISCILIAILALVGVIVFYNGNGIDYTDEFLLYKEVYQESTVTEVTQKLVNSKLDYTIENSVLSIHKYSNISFDVKSNNCAVCENNLMEAFLILDSKDLNKITEKGIYNESTDRYEKMYEYSPSCKVVLVNEKYTGFSKTLINFCWSVIVFMIITIITSTVLLLLPLIKNKKS